MQRLVPGRVRLRHRIAAAWRTLDLSQQFLIASAVTIVIAMLLVGTWLSRRIEHTVTQNSALETALYVESFVGERIQGLAEDPTFNPKVQEELEALVVETPLGRRIISFKVWMKGNKVIYSSRPEHLGQVFGPTENLKRAWTGAVAFEYDELDEDESSIERELSIPILEIYVPVRKRFGGDVHAIVEFYQDATQLSDDIYFAKLEAWTLLACIGAAVVAALYGMAAGASGTIQRQRAALNDRILELSRLLDQNMMLRQRVETASRRAAGLNERYLRRLGSDLHDGPAQFISLALFRLDASGRSATPTGATPNDLAPDDKSKIRDALQEALKEIRELSIGLSMPEIDTMDIGRTIREAVNAHENRTDSRVQLDLGALPQQTSRDIKVAAYRLVQEGLNNTSRHAAGARVTVAARSDGDAIEVTVVDNGPGFDPRSIENRNRLGLVGLNERIENIGGSLDVTSAPGAGTRLVARLPAQQGSLT